MNDRPRVLVLTKTTGYRHDSIPAGVRAIQRLGQSHRFTVDTTSSTSRFTTKGLARYDAVIFLSATGTPVARRAQQRAFERYIRGGGGYLGVHAASDTRGKWAWYEGLVGARFTRHAPGTARATVRVEDRESAATKDLPAEWTRTDEWYEFDRNPRGRVRVLATVDESTYRGGTMGADHPIAWCHRYDGGRSVYTAMGHTRESFSERRFLAHLQGAIEMATGRARFDCAP
ncbi:ThuA domain-containing protein [Solirubrobacter phytolaccae]|uniref:ThuA domain-containing protein n=1 Tax=Solirubrobacter phytolaccae TaxID=1404360 RepID=A0A9X3NDQ0_9ACTN|nr:ThuA domain-containing protein [Solirubrobacter phytolaccae]MDA0184583.1 ThuA domain-containing protein [Solirubrobacter phytolaccae]